MKALQLKQSFKNNIADIYNLIGKDDGVIQYAVEKFLELIPEEQREYCVSRFEGNDSSHEDIINSLYYGSMFGDRKLIIVKDYSAKLDEKQGEEWINYLENMDGSNILVLINSPSITKYVDRFCVVVECDKLSLPECINYIETIFKFYKVRYDKNAPSDIANICNRDFAKLNNELKKIMLYSGQDIVVDKFVVEQLVPANTESKIYDFINYLQDREYEKAMSLIQVLRERGEKPVALLALMTSTYKNIFAIMTNNCDEETLCKTLGIKNTMVFMLKKKIEDYRRKIPNYLTKIKNALYYLYALEKDFKSGKITPDNALDSAIVYLMGKTNAV